MRPIRRGAALALALLATGAAGARAEDIADALARAYQTNPSLQSQRFELRALDEAYVQAHAGVRPSAELQVSADYADNRFGDSAQALRLVADPTVGRRLETNQGQAMVVLEQPLYSGGQASGAIEGAALRIRGGRTALRVSEGDLLLQVIATYADVRRDMQSLEVRRRNLAALERQLDITTARQEAGEVTRTDVAQAQAQRQAALAQIAAAQVQLQASRATYAALVGENPGELAPETPLPLLPATLDEAFDRAEEGNPDLEQARLAEQQSRLEAQMAKTAARPRVTARTAYGVSGEFAPFYSQDQDTAWTATISVSKPLFAGGAFQAAYRGALDRNGADRLRIEAARRQVIQNVLSAWNQAAAMRANIQVQIAQVAAAEVAFDGMSEEFRVGQRSTLDVLVAEQTLREAQLSLLSSRRDAYVAEAALLRQLGLLEMGVLTTGVRLYDPSAHLREVRRKGAAPWEGLLTALDRVGRGELDPLRVPPVGGGRPAVMAPAAAEVSRTVGTTTPNAAQRP
jgi:outer membrane protein